MVYSTKAMNEAPTSIDYGTLPYEELPFSQEVAKESYLEEHSYFLDIAYFLLILSLSIVYPVLQLSYSPLAYFRLEDITWALLVFGSVLVGINFSLAGIRKLSNINPLIILGIIAFLSLGVTLFKGDMAMSFGNSLWFQFRFMQCAFLLLITMLIFPYLERAFFLKCIFFMGIIIGMIGILQYYNLMPLYIYNDICLKEGGYASYTMSILSYNSAHLGSYMIAAIFIGYGALLQNNNLFNKLIIISGITILIIALLLSRSRSCWIGFILGNLVFFFRKKNFGLKIALLSAMALLFFLILSYLPDLMQPINERIYDRGSTSTIYGRFHIYGNFFEAIYKNPLIAFFGVGFMNWRYYLTRATGASAGHNVYLQVFGDLGIGGLLVFLWFWLRTFKMASRLAKQGDGWAIGYLSMLTGYLAASLSAEILYPVPAMENFLMLFFLITGIVLSPYRANTVNELKLS